MSTDTVTIMMDVYRNLVRADIILDMLEAGGVDNWEWYGDSVDFDVVDEEVEKAMSEV